MKKIANVGLLLGVLTFMPSGARCDLAVPYYPIPIETISGTVIDQSLKLTNYTTGFLDPIAMLAQTFTVGQNGELSAIAITLNASTPITLNVLRTSHGVPTSTILASAVAVPGNSYGTWTYYNFTSSRINVHAGEVLAFQPSTTVSGGQAIGIALSVRRNRPILLWRVVRHPPVNRGYRLAAFRGGISRPRSHWRC
jgi:hypothetical protein